MNFIIQLIVGLVLSLASTLIRSMFQQDQKPKVPGVRGSIQTGGDNPLSFIMGFYATGGHLKYAGTWGNSGGTPNAYCSKVVSVSDLPIRSFAGFFVNGERVTLAATQTGDLGFAVLEYRVGGKDHLWIKTYTGDQTVADPLMRAKFGSNADRPYTADMIGRGVAYFVATTLVNRELFTGIPEYMAEVNGIPLDDPRGDDRHDNPMVGIYTLMKGIKYDGKWVYGPQNITDANFVYANLEAQMDKCDAIRAGTSERRFRFGYEVSVDAEPHAVIGELLKACEGRIAEVGGTYKFLVGEPDAPVVSITDDDIVITDGQTYEPFPGFENLFNGIGATYPEPAEGWQSKEAPPRYRSDLEVLDDGRRLPFTTDYKAVPFALQVQELMRAAIEEVRRFRRTTKTMPPEWWEFEPLDSYIWTSARNGFVNKQFIVTAMDDLPNGNQFVGDQEIDPADYSWSSDYVIPWDVAPLVIARPEPQITTGFTAAPYVVVDDAAAQRRAAIEVFWDAGLADVRSVRVQVRESWDTKAVIADMSVDYDADEVSPSRVIANPAILPNKLYEARGIYLPFSGRITRWSNQDVDGTEGPWLTVTTPDVPDADVTNIQVAQLGKELQNAHGLVTGTDATDIPARLAELQQRADELALAVLDFNATTRETLNILSVHSEGASAAVIRNEKAIVEQGYAFAQSLTEVVASLNDVIADGMMKFEAEVDELASIATITAKARATFGSDLSQAAWILKAEADGLGGSNAYFGVLGAFYVFESVDGPPIPVFSATAEGIEFTNGVFAGEFKSKAKQNGAPKFFFDGETGDWGLGA